MQSTAITISSVGPARKGRSCLFRSVSGTNDAGDNVNMRSVWTETARCKYAKVYDTKLKITLAPPEDMQSKMEEWDTTLGEAVQDDEGYPYKSTVCVHERFGASVEAVAYEGGFEVCDNREGDQVKVPGTLEQHVALLKGKYIKLLCNMSTMTQYKTNGGASKLLIKVRGIVIEPEPEQEDEDWLATYTPTRKRDREDEPCMSPNKRACV